MLMMLAAAAAGTPDPPRTLLDGYMTVGGIIILIGLVASVMTILRALRATRRENAKDAQESEDRLMARIDKHTDSLDDRVKEIEITSRDFMPRAEIEKAIDHEKNNRLTAQAALKESVDRAGENIIQLRVGLGKLEQVQVSLASDMGEIKALVKEQGRDTANRLDKMNDCLTAISRKVG